MDKVRDIVGYFAAAMAVFALLGAVYQAFNGQKGSSLTLATLFVVASVFVYLPMFDFFKMLGVEGKLKQINEAVASLDSVKRLSQISARATYLSMAWGNRMGTPPAHVKQSVLDQIDAQLSELNVNEAERRSIQQPFIRMVKLDFYFLFTGVLRSYAGLLNKKLTTAQSATPHSTDAQTATIRHSDLITAWSQRTNDPDPSIKLEKYTLEEVLNDFIPRKGEWLDEEDLAIIHRFKDEIVRMNADCEAKGGYTKAAAEYYDKYAHDGNATRATQLFNEKAQR